MNEKHNHIDYLTPEILRAYHAGELSKSQMHQVEKLMLDDPFYADAFEGLEGLANDMLDKDLDLLDQKLDDLVTEDSPTGFPWYKAIAATFVLAIVAVLVFFQDSKDPPIDEIKSIPPATAPAPAQIMADEAEVQQEDSLLIDTTYVPQVTPDQTLTTSTSEAKKDISLDDQTQESNEMELEILFEEEPDEAVTSVADLEVQKPKILDVEIPMRTFDRDIDSIAASIRQEASATRQLSRTASARIVAPLNVEGTIVGSDDKLPLPGVSVFIKGTSEGVATDLEGNFSLAIPQEQGQTLVIRYLGYLSQEIEIKGSKSLKIELEPDVQSLGEVVVTGYGVQQKEEIKRNAFARPENGFQSLNRYFRENIRYPQEHSESGIQGRVTVIFYIETDGRITRLQIEGSLGEAFDKEAIRLIREGPNWEPATDDEGAAIASQMKVRIRFKE